MRGWIKRHKILAALALLLVTPASLNYSGFCWAEKRWLSDEERIDIEINKQIGKSQEYVFNGPSGPGNYDVVPYASVQEFLERNPECCRVGDFSVQSFWQMFRRIIGKDSRKIIYINYKQRVILNGKVLDINSGPTEANMRLQTNCGQLFPRN